jgi:hypothetical protein
MLRTETPGQAAGGADGEWSGGPTLVEMTGPGKHARVGGNLCQCLPRATRPSCIRTAVSFSRHQHTRTGRRGGGWS